MWWGYVGYIAGACELHVEAIDPSIETIHVYNMVGYYIIGSGVGPPHGVGGGGKLRKPSDGAPWRRAV